MLVSGVKSQAASIYALLHDETVTHAAHTHAYIRACCCIGSTWRARLPIVADASSPAALQNPVVLFKVLQPLGNTRDTPWPALACQSFAC